MCVLQCVLREALEEMSQFFSVNSSCRLPLNPALHVKGINIQVLAHMLTPGLLPHLAHMLTPHDQPPAVMSCCLQPQGDSAGFDDDDDDDEGSNPF